MPNEVESKSRYFWWPTIKQIADSFENSLIKKFGIAQLDAKRLEDALEMYERGWWSFKEQVYKKNAKEERIDAHKIIAIYILSFLKNEPFRIVSPETEDDSNECLFLANEYFSLAIAQALIYANTKSEKIFQLSKNEINWFIIILNNMKLKHEQLKTQRTMSPDKLGDMVDILSLAQIIYYIEKIYAAQAPTANP